MSPTSSDCGEIAASVVRRCEVVVVVCRAVTCPVCSRTTWAGCGRHVAHLAAQVPPGQWCLGHVPDATVALRSRAPVRIAVGAFVAVAALTAVSAVGTHIVDTQPNQSVQSTR